MPDFFDLLKQNTDRLTQPANVGGLSLVTPTKVINPFKYSTTDALGSSRYMQDESRFDAGLMRGDNVNEHRSDNQNGWWLAGATLGRVVGQGLSKVSQGFSILGSAVGAGVAGVIDATGLDNAFGVEMDDRHHSIDRIVSNPINQVFFDLENKVKEIMPVYHADDWEDRSASDKFFGNFGEWLADQGSDGIAFALSAIIPSAAVSKLGIGASLLGSAGRGATALSRTLATLGATEKGIDLAAKGINLAAQYGIQTSTEALFEAKDTGEQFMQKYLESVNSNLAPEQQYQSINDLPQDMQTDAKDKMRSAMKNDYWWNMIALAPSNLFEIGLINRFIGKAGGKAINAINAGENIADDAVASVARQFEGVGVGKFKKLSKSIYNAASKIDGTRIGSALSTIPKSIAAEGLYEENIQSQISDMSQQYGLEGKSGYFLETGLGAAKQAVEALLPSNLNDDRFKDTRESILAGAFIGSLFGGVAGATSEYNANKREAQARKTATDEAINYLNSAKSDFLSQDLYETNEVVQEDGSTKKQIIFNEDGTPKVNEKAVANFLANQKRMSDLVATEEYYNTTGQKELANIVRNERTTNWVLSHLQAGKADQMFAKLDDLAKAKPEDLQTLGFDPSYYGEDGQSVPVSQRVNELRRKASDIKRNYEIVSKNVPYEQTGRIEELVKLKSRIDAMNEQVSGLQAQRDEASLDYSNDTEEVKQIDMLTRRLRALEKSKGYLDARRGELTTRTDEFTNSTSAIDENTLSRNEREAFEGQRSIQSMDAAKIDFASQIHDEQIADTKKRIDDLKTLYKEQLEASGKDATVGKYNLYRNASKRSTNILDAENRIAQLEAAVQEHQYEYDELMKPYDGAVRYNNRLSSTFRRQLSDALIEDNNNVASELPVSEFETRAQAPQPVINNNEISAVPQPDIEPEVLNSDPASLTESLELPEVSGNQLDNVRDSATTGGRLDQTKLDKFAHDNLGKTLKVTYEGNDAGIFGQVRLGSTGVPTFVQQNGREMPIERLLGGKIKSIEVVTRQSTATPKTEEAPTTKQSAIVTKKDQQEFDNLFYSSSKPYLSVGLNSTTGIDSQSDPTQERWFRTSENLNLSDGKYTLLTVTQKNQQAAKDLLGSDWNDDLLYDATTIKVVLLRDGQPVKSNQFGEQRADGELVYTALRLTPAKERIGVVEARNSVDVEKLGITGFTHQNNPRAQFIVTADQVKSGVADDLLKRHQAWRDEILADTNTRVFGVTSKGSGLRVKGKLGSVQGRLTEGQTVDVIIAKSNSVSDPSGKSITVKPGLTYTEYKGMVVPLTGRNLTTSEQSVVKEVLKRWSKAASEQTLNNMFIDLSNAIDAKDKLKIADLRDKIVSAGSIIPYNLIQNESYSAEELQSLYDKGLALTNERNQYKQYLEDTIRFGDSDAFGIYVERGNIIFNGQSIPQEALWDGRPTEDLDKFLADKYLQVSSRALSSNKTFTEYILQDGDLVPRNWNSYNEYLTSNEYPDESVRNDDEIPLRTSLAPIGEAQFNSVNLRFTGVTEATKPERTDTKAYNTISKPEVVNAIPFSTVANIANTMSDNEIYRVGLRLTDRSQGQQPFYIDYRIVNGKPEFISMIKRDGTVTNAEPKSMIIVRQELENPNSEDRPSDLPYEYLSVEKAPSFVENNTVTSTPVIQEVVESVQPATVIVPETTTTIDAVLSAFNGEFKGSMEDLRDFISDIEASGETVTPENIAKSFEQIYPGSVAPKVAPTIKRRQFRGMTADNRVFRPVDLNTEEAWFKERFPNVDYQRVSGLIEGKYWGLMDSAVGVLVSDEAVQGTTYHEAFHVASLLYHTDAERQAVYKEYRDRTGRNIPDEAVEEALADEFRDYVLSNGQYQFPDKQKSFFQKLWDMIKSLFIDNKIEDVFERINNGGYAKLSVNLNIQASAPMKADLAEEFSKSHALLDDMTVNFFNHFFQDGNNIDTLYNVFNAGKQSILIDGIYDQMYQDYVDRAEEGTLLHLLTNPEVWQKNVKLHKQELSNLGLKIVEKPISDNTSAEDNSPADFEVEGQKDNAQFESHIEFSSKEGMPKIVKFFLSSLPELQYYEENGQRFLEHVPTAYGTDKLANPEKLMNILGNQLAGITDINQMVDRIKTLSEDYPTLTALVKRMQVGDELLPTTATENHARFQTQFWQQFAKANHDYLLTFIRDDGTVSVIDSTSETQQQVTKDLWRTNLISELNNPNAVIRIDNQNKLVVDKNKVQQLRSIENPFIRAERLGIRFTFPDKIRADEAMFKQFRENLDAIINTIIATKQPVTDLYTRQGLNAQNRIKTLTDLEARTNPDSIERQHIGIDNKTLYSLTLNNSLSLAVNEISNQSGNYYEAVRNSAYSQNSIILKEGRRIGLAISEGVKRQTGEQVETSKLTPADAFASQINGILNGQYSILRPSDKKLEYKLGFGEFVETNNLITRDGKYSAKVNKIFRGYLQDEFNRVFATRAGYANNIQKFKDRTILKNGRIDLGLFNDILKPLNIPVLNNVEDAAAWIEENKLAIDEEVRKYLESTTNQYGATARKLSVFKETVEKTGRRTFKPTGQYIINGVSDEDINRILGKDATDRYTAQDIHQFFRYITVNQLIGNIEQTKLTTGAIEFYGDPLKRFSALTGTKKMSRVDAAYENWARVNRKKVGYLGNNTYNLTQDGNVRIVVVKDIITSAPQEVLSNFREGLKANGLSKSEIDKVVDKFKNINEADAQSWMTLPSYREFMDRAGDWSNSHEEAYQKAVRGKALTADEIFLFPPLKPQAFGPQQSKNIYSPFFLKTSISPLIPSVVKGTDLEQIMRNMYENDIDITSTESAVKVGGKVDAETNQFRDLYLREGDNAVVNTSNIDKSLVSVLPYEYMGIQLDVAPIRKNSTTRGTQQEKLLMSNISNIPNSEDIVSRYRDTINKLVELGKKKMFSDLGIQRKGDNYIIPDRTKLLNYLEDQAIRRGVPTNTLIGLREALTNGSTLDAVVNKDRIDNILSAMITNSVIKSKRAGEQKVQVATTGYNARVFEGSNLRTSDKLKPYIYDPTGTKPMEVMVALPKALVPFVEKIGGLAEFNKRIAEGNIDERILKGIGFRIPTQQLSSMVYYKVKEFLPYESGPVVVLPSVITTIAGSDFDIDKLSMYEKNYSINYGSITLDFRPNLRRELNKAGLLDQFRLIYDNKLPEELTDEEIGDLVQASKEAILEDEADRMDNILVEMQKKYTSKPSLRYIDSTGEDEKALQNRILEINEEVLSHPSNFKNLIAPIGNEVLSGLASEMVDLRSNQTAGSFNAFEVSEANPYPSAQLMNMNYLLEQGQRFQAGKDLLGIAAKQNTHHILSQLSELYLKPEVTVWFDEAKGEALRLDNVTDLSGKHQISDIISEFINGFVDIVKDQFVFDLNANKETINPFFFLTRIGVPIESVVSFMNQPVIRKYLNERNIHNSLIAKGLPEAYRKSRYQILNGLREELYAIAKTNPSLYARSQPFAGELPHFYKDEEAKDKVRANYKFLKKNALDGMITNPNTPEAALGQLQVLDQFLQYQDYGNQLTNLMMLTSADTDGVKKSLTRSYVQKAMYKEFLNDKSTMFANPESVVEGSLIKSYHDVVEEGESYFAGLFDSKSNKSNLLRHQMVHNLSSLGIDDATDLLKRFENHLVTHMLHNVTTEQFPISLSEEAVKTTLKRNDDGTVSPQPSLLLGDNSAVNSLIRLKKTNELPNEFINSLFGIRGIDRTEGNYVDTIRMFTKRINKQAADLLSGAATDLLNVNPSLAKRIFRTTLVQSGLNNSYMSYHNLLPAKWFHNFVSNIMDVYRNEDIPTDNVIDDFYRNYWRNNNLVPSVESRALSSAPELGNGVVKMSVNSQYANSLYIKQWGMPQGVSRADFFRLRNDESIPNEEKPQWELYFYKFADFDDNFAYFERVNPLGLSERHLETSLAWKNQSIHNANNKVEGDYVSSEYFNLATDYEPDLGILSPQNVPVSNEVRDRLQAIITDDTISIDDAIKLYQQKIVEGMSQEQAVERAEHEITCR